MRTCHHCGRELSLFSAKVERTAGCPSCHSDLKVCRNCRLHDPGANNQCAEPQAECYNQEETDGSLPPHRTEGKPDIAEKMVLHDSD